MVFVGEGGEKQRWIFGTISVFVLKRVVGSNAGLKRMVQIEIITTAKAPASVSAVR